MITDDGGKSFGEDVERTLIYSENGYMSANILSMSRKMNLAEGISEESIFAGKVAYLSYSGRYILLEGEKLSIM